MPDFSSKDSVDYPCQTCKETKSTIFLTFDDGIEAGTEEVYYALKEKGVPGTFFCVGENVLHNNKNSFFNTLYSDPTMMIGNHSMTHAHQFYDSFYGEKNGLLYGKNDDPKAIDGLKGLRVNAETGLPDAVANHSEARRSVLMDFEYANHAFTMALTKTCIDDPKYAPNYTGMLETGALLYSRFLIARMPGTNTWLVDGIEDHASSTRDEEGESLKNNGYKIYGWDLEWGMTFQIKDAQKKEYRAGKDGFLDLYSDEFIDMDRPTETAEMVFQKVKSSFNAWFSSGLKKENKLVLLFHERAFRKYKKENSNKHIQELSDFIGMCLNEGYAFDVIENY